MKKEKAYIKLQLFPHAKKELDKQLVNGCLTGYNYGPADKAETVKVIKFYPSK